MNQARICRLCGRRGLNKTEIGLNKKLLDPDAKRFFCLACLAGYLETEPEVLKEKAREFKRQGCPLFG